MDYVTVCLSKLGLLNDNKYRGTLTKWVHMLLLIRHNGVKSECQGWCTGVCVVGASSLYDACNCMVKVCWEEFNRLRVRNNCNSHGLENVICSKLIGKKILLNAVRLV